MDCADHAVKSCFNFFDRGKNVIYFSPVYFVRRHGCVQGRFLIGLKNTCSLRSPNYRGEQRFVGSPPKDGKLRMDDTKLFNDRACINCWPVARHIVTQTLIIATALCLTASTLMAAPQSTEQVSDAAQEILVRGAKLETEKQWGEALSLYQQAVRKYPENRSLQTRRSVARIHYDVQRRYADSSFVTTITTTEVNKAAGVYSEVLLKVQSYYVDQPKWAEIASFGLTSLEVALMSPEFQKINLPDVSTEQIHQSILQTRERLKNVRVNDRNQAYDVAIKLSQDLHQSIGLSQQATIYEFVCGAISALDPYSAFMSSAQYGETMSQIEGNFVGLGVELRTHADHLEIINVIRGGSASQGGIVGGDRVVAVDGQTVEKIGSDRVADLMRGPEGSLVSVTLDRGNGPQILKLERRRVEIPSVDQVGIVDEGSGIAYIQLTNFQKTTARDFDAALWKLSREGMRSLIVDLRGNPGGLLPASVEVADRFINSGVIVSTKGRNPMEDFTHRAKAANTWRVPLVVLVDENSASASEIFAAAIRDHDRGVIVGSRSYGKGSVQGIFPLNISGGGVRLTTAKFFSPTGKAINQIGVAADVEIHDAAKPAGDAADISSDNGLRIGIQTARRELNQQAAKVSQFSSPSRTRTSARQFQQNYSAVAN
jgi:carboxyl-terminal processing protease